MRLEPPDLDTLKVQVAKLHHDGGRVESIDLKALNRVVAHCPEDLTVTVEAGATLHTLQQHLARAGQWLPIDPPHADQLSIGALLAANASGSRRYGYGTAREHLIGLAVVLADGRLVRSGGRVVKNVAGYDLLKLFVGSRGTLGVIVEATFKLSPLPETEQLVQASPASLAEAGALLDQVARCPATPVLIDLHNLASDHPDCPLRLVLGFAGCREAVQHHVEHTRQLGFDQPAGLQAQARFWSDTSPARRRSVLPSKTMETIAELGDTPFLAHAGNGVIHYRGGPEPPQPSLPWTLLRRVKNTFDPTGVFPDPPWSPPK
jgi:glycolate oxidase FAD binding subunit